MQKNVLSTQYSLLVLSIFLVVPICSLQANNLPNSIDYTMFMLATEKDDTSAQYLIGRKYYLGTRVTENKTEAAKWFGKAAGKGHAKASYYLGIMYMYGDGVQKNAAKAEQLLTMAAKKNHNEAEYELGNFYFFGHSGKKKPKLAVNWYKAAAEAGHAKAQFQLGKIQYGGIGVKADQTLGKKWLQLAYENGITQANEILNTSNNKTPPAVMIAKSNHSNKKKSTRDSEVTKEIKQAEAGNVDAQYSVGIRFLKGDSVKKNSSSAVKWLRKAAEQDHAGAQYQLGILYRDGAGVSKSETEAIKWLRLASSWGINKAQHDLDALIRKQLLASKEAFTANPELASPDSQFALGIMYVDGKGVDKDPNTAAQWFLKAARQNHAEAQYRLGEMYKNGIGVDSDTKEAKLWLTKAAGSGLVKASKVLEDILRAEEQRILAKELQNLKNSPIYPYLLNATTGDVDAKFQVGIMYIKGEDAPRDVHEGVRWLQSAANSNHLAAQVELGKLYFNGAQLIEKDYLVALKWFEKAADNGEADAQYHLGTMYRNGLGVRRSNAEAVKWFRLAAKQGHKSARNQLGGCKNC